MAQIKKSYRAQTSIRFRDLNAIEEWEDVRQALGLDLPVRPLSGAVDRYTHPEPDEWHANQQAALARGGAHAQAVAGFFADHIPAKETVVVTATFNPVVPLGKFCADTENLLPTEKKPLVTMFYSQLTKRQMRVALYSQFAEEWERFLSTAGA